jgi:hypothetical protein
MLSVGCLYAAAGCASLWSDYWVWLFPLCVRGDFRPWSALWCDGNIFMSRYSAALGVQTSYLLCYIVYIMLEYIFCCYHTCIIVCCIIYIMITASSQITVSICRVSGQRISVWHKQSHVIWQNHRTDSIWEMQHQQCSTWRNRNNLLW